MYLQGKLLPDMKVDNQQLTECGHSYTLWDKREKERMRTITSGIGTRGATTFSLQRTGSSTKKVHVVLVLQYLVPKDQPTEKPSSQKTQTFVIVHLSFQILRLLEFIETIN